MSHSADINYGNINNCHWV